MTNHPYLDRKPRTLAQALFQLRRRAWTGGTTPGKRKDRSETERQLSALFQAEQIREYQRGHGRNPPHSVRKIFWNRSRHDAHATLREFERS